MPEPSKLAAALAKVQAKLPSVAKGETAEVVKEGRKLYDYQYADLTAVSEAILPLLGANGLAFTAWPTLDDGRFVLSYSLLHESGEKLTGTYPLPASGRPQDIGGVITYARRYCLCAVTGIAPGGDDTDAAGGQEVQMDRRGPERYSGTDRPRDNSSRVRVPIPGPDHERLVHSGNEPMRGWDGEDHWIDQPPGEFNGSQQQEPRPQKRSRSLSPAQAIHVHLKRLGVTDEAGQLVKATMLAGRTEDGLLEHISDLDDGVQRQMLDELAKCRNADALKELLDRKRAEVPS